MDTSPRINSARMADYIGMHVRLPCKVIRMPAGAALVEAADGGQVEVRPQTANTPLEIPATYVEVVGQVEDAGTIKMLVCIGLGEDLDLKLVNTVIEMSHEPRFQNMFSTNIKA